MSEFLSNRRKVFIISAGRTGTTFLGKILDEVFKRSSSFHEPDSIHTRDLDRPADMLRQIRHRGGLVRQAVLKAVGRTGGRNLSLLRLQGRITGTEAMNRFVRDREWAAGLDCDLYIEANHQLHGLVEDLTTLENTQVVLITRSPIPWITSWLNYDYSWYGPRDWLQKIDLLGAKRLAPKHVGQSCPEWDTYSQTHRLAWLWAYMHENFLSSAKSHPDRICLLRFEELFEDRSLPVLERFVRAVDPGCDVPRTVDRLLIRLEEKVNSSYRPGNTVQRALTDKETNIVRKICGSVAEQLGY